MVSSHKQSNKRFPLNFTRTFFIRLIHLSLREYVEFLWCRKHLSNLHNTLNEVGLISSKNKLIESCRVPDFLFPTTDITRISLAISRAAKYSIGKKDTCLRRSLLLWWILEQRGVSSDLRIGMIEGNGSLVGHAWVEIDGEPVGERKEKIGLYKIVDFNIREYSHTGSAISSRLNFE